jgi:hypothetical protein
VISADGSAARRAAGYFPLRTVLGGVEVTPGDIEAALRVLRSAPGLMIRQPLARAGSPLASCLYHDVAAPWRGRFSSSAPSGRGAAGRPVAKEAFCFALERALESVSPAVALAQLLDDALAAFAVDHTYAAAMARSAVGFAAKRHSAALRTQLRQAAHQAVSECEARRGEFACENRTPCGTGACKFAQGDLALITVESLNGRQERPANSVLAGRPFSSDDALASLEALRPFTVPVPVRDGDAGQCVDAGAAG